MTNEELAVQIQQGDKAAMSQLWDQMKGLVFKQAYSYYSRCRARCEACGVDLDDLNQEGYLALMGAVKAFVPEKGYKLSTYLNYHMLNSLNGMLMCRTERQKNDPLTRSKSLDDPLLGYEDADLTQGDAIPDNTAEAAFELMEEEEFNRQLHEALEKCLNTLPDDQKEVIVGKYYENHTYEQIAQIRGSSRENIRGIEHKGLRSLRKPKSYDLLRDFNEEIISRAYRGTGYSAFYHSWSSVEERIAEYLEERCRQNSPQSESEDLRKPQNHIHA